MGTHKHTCTHKTSSWCVNISNPSKPGVINLVLWGLDVSFKNRNNRGVLVFPISDSQLVACQNPSFGRSGQWSGPLWQRWCGPEKNDPLENEDEDPKIKKKPRCLSWVKGACQDDIPFSTLQDTRKVAILGGYCLMRWHPKPFEVGWIYTTDLMPPLEGLSLALLTPPVSSVMHTFLWST